MNWKVAPVRTRIFTIVVMATLALSLTLSAMAATISSRREARSSHKLKENATTERRMASSRHSRAQRAAGSDRAASGKRVGKRGGKSAQVAASKLPRSGTGAAKPAKVWERFTASSYDGDPSAGDIVGGEDAVVRAAAVDALGSINGTVVAIDPSNGRILAMVNQKLALSGGAEPCSTIKVSVALAALSEGIVTRTTPVNLGGWKVTMDQALAHSNNQYFETLGRRLGFQRVSYYAHQFGLGELAGWNISGEHLGVYPREELPARAGGVGRMCSFGESVNMTPLQLGALMASIANGGTLYYLQHPRNPSEVANFQPKVKRYLDIAPLIPEISVGLLGTTQYGTGRSLRTNFTSEQVLGKTGTCSNAGTRFGWFVSYTNSRYGRIVTVFFLRGDHAVFGPKAAELAGRFYHELDEHNYFAGRPRPLNSATLHR